MNQRAKRSRNYRQDSAGSNVLFTLGLISVVALLIVGWVMTKGGMDNVFSSNNNDSLPAISANPTPPPQPTATPQPSPSGFTITTSDPMVERPTQQQIAEIRSQFEAKIRREFEEKLEQEEQVQEKQKQQIDQLQRKIEDLQMQIQMLEIDNRNLREDEG